MSTLERVRPAGVAGSFYPGDPERLTRDVDAMLEQTTGPSGIGRPRILLEPHAGYVYSGAVAAEGYALLDESPPQTFILIGPSHFEAFAYSSVFAGDAYETPLGRVDVDGSLAEKIAADSPLVRFSAAGHLQPNLPYREHGLEVQLPFLQRVAPSARIVPIVMGDQSWPACEALGGVLAPLLERPDVTVIVSSDLSHFYPYDTARRMDGRFCDALATQDAEALHEAVASGECEACGAGPMIAALAANRDRTTACRVLKTRNSGDVTGDRHSVVGYACAVIHEETEAKG